MRGCLGVDFDSSGFTSGLVEKLPTERAGCPIVDRSAQVAAVARAAIADEAFPQALERKQAFFNPLVLTCPPLVLLILAVVILVVVLGFIPGLCRQAYEHFDPETRALAEKVDEMKSTVMRGQLAAMQACLPKVEEDAECPTVSIPYDAPKSYERDLNHLIRWVHAPAPEGREVQARVLEIRRRLRALMQTDTYKRRFKSDDADIVLLQNMARAFKTGGHSAEVMKEVGRQILRRVDGDQSLENVSFAQFATSLVNAYETLPALHRSGWAMKLLWWCAHPGKALESMKGEGFLTWLGYHPDDYNSYEHGNVEQAVGFFVDAQGHRRLFYHGPGLGQDREIDCAFLQAQKRDGFTHIQLSMENDDHEGESERLRSQFSMDEVFDSLTMTTAQLDGPEEKGAGLGDDATVKDHFNAIGKAVRDGGEHRYVLGEGKDALDPAQRAVEEAVERDAGTWNNLTVRRRARVCLVTFEVFAKLKLLLNVMGAQEVLGAERARLLAMHTSGEACKQDIDRAIVINVLTQICIAKIRGEPITAELQEFLTGMTFARTIMVDGRAILRPRFEAIPDFLRIFNDYEEGLGEALLDYLGEGAEGLSFERGRDAISL